MDSTPLQTPEPMLRSPSRPRTGRLRLLLALVAALAVAAWGIFGRIEASRALRQETEEQAIPTVMVMKAPRGPASQELVLPGNVQAFYEAPIYARVNGYLKSWSTDIGAHVKAGQVLGEIDAPDLDQQFRQAEADLTTAEANQKLAHTTAQRWQALLATDSVSKQTTDEKVSDAAAKDAVVAAARANLARLRELEGFKRIVAPFDGVVTVRNTDIGALINSGSGAGNGPELFRVAETDRLRIYVQVPQTYAPRVKPGLVAELHFAEYPGRTFPATLVETAQALDPRARTLLVQLQAGNAKGELFPGGYAEVHMKLPSSADTVRLPVNTLIFQSEGMQVATVDGQGQVSLKPITIGRDFGTEVEVLAGVAPGDAVIVNPPDSLTTGETVRVVQGGGPQPRPGAGRNAGQNDGRNVGKNGAAP